MNIKLLLPVLIVFSFTLYSSDVENTLRELSTPVKPTAQGFTHFLKHTYNHPDYLDVLAHNFSHLIQFLEHGKQTQQPNAYPQSVFRLFTIASRRCSYINAYAFNALLQELRNLLLGNFHTQRTNDQNLLQQKINQLIYNRFMAECSALKNNTVPHEAASSIAQELTQEIVTSLSNQTIGDISHEELRKTILIFLEVGLAKLIWSPEDQLDTWQSVKNISEALASYMDNIIIDIEDLDGLFIALIERYCLFLELAGNDLSLAYYEAIKADIANSSLMLFELEEQESYLETKRDRLLRAVEGARKKAYPTE